MSDQPKTLDAVLAEMREAGRSDERADGPLIEDFADRIEAAAKRERAITDIMLAVKGKPLPHPDPDNAPPLFFPMTKTQLQTLSDLVAIAHDEMDGLPHHEQELERFDSLLFDMKARYAFDKPYTAPPEHPSNAALIVAAVNERDRLRDLVRRLARVAQDTLDFAEAMSGIIPDHPERAKARSEITSLLREARAAIGEGQP